MYPIQQYLTAGLFFLLFFTNCTETENQESAQQPQDTVTELETSRDLQIDDPRARAASEGSMSAAYFTISNHTSSPDTLLSISSDVAQLIEIHESFEMEDGMMGMRETGALEIPAGSVIHLEPGGYHIMLIRLNETLETGDQFDLTLHFSQKGEETVQVTVQQI